MSIEWKLLGVIIAVLTFASTGCSAICSTCSVADRGIAASNNEIQGPTVEIRGRSHPNKEYVPKSVAVKVVRGNVLVSVVPSTDANRVVFVAKGVRLTDNQAELKFIQDTVEFDRDNVEVVEIAPGDDVPGLDVHIYVRKEVPIKIDAGNGDIRISGNTGPITAVAGNGSIDVRGSTHDLDLTARGTNHGITVDGAHNRLTLHADNGPIEITAEDMNVNASTGVGDILFVGKLSPLYNYFTTTGNSNITVVMPLFDLYAIEASTSVNTIDVQYPARAAERNVGNPICGTFDSGPPYIMRLDDHDHYTRGQVTLNQGDVRSAGPVRLVGLVAPNYFVFHSTARNVLLEAPSVSEFFIETLPGDRLTVRPIATDQPLTPTLQSTPSTPPPQPPVQDATIPPELLKTFMETPAAAAVELSPGQAQSTPMPMSATGGSLMYSLHCPVKNQVPNPERVKIFATSGGGHIRIYQTLP